MEPHSFKSVIWKLIFNSDDGIIRPDTLLPEEKLDFKKFLQTAPHAKSIWFGHSSFLMRFEEKSILVDPVLSNRASPIPFTVPRFQDPIIKPDELPKIDYVLISHDHYDHLDEETIVFFKRKKTIFIVPLGVKQHLTKWGIEDDRILELDWWQSIRYDHLEFVLTPAQHFSGRGISDRAQTLWGSWVISGSKQRFYFSGDSGYSPHFKEIGEKYGPFTAAFIESGQYNTHWRSVHLLPEEWHKAYKDLKANAYLPVHWGAFSLALHPWHEPATYLSKHREEYGIHLIVPKIGQITEFDQKPKELSPWWEPLIKVNEK